MCCPQGASKNEATAPTGPPLGRLAPRMWDPRKSYWRSLRALVKRSDLRLVGRRPKRAALESAEKHNDFHISHLKRLSRETGDGHTFVIHTYLDRDIYDKIRKPIFYFLHLSLPYLLLSLNIIYHRREWTLCYLCHDDYHQQWLPLADGKKKQ